MRLHEFDEFLWENRFVIYKSPFWSLTLKKAICKSAARELGCHPTEIEILNPRWLGDSFTYDGVRVWLP